MNHHRQKWIDGNDFPIYVQILVLLVFMIIFAPHSISAQKKCGGLNQPPCVSSEKVDPCKKGLREDFRTDRCVSALSLARISFLRLCNNDASEVISFVIVLWNSASKKWMAEGWYRITDLECTTVEIPGSYQGYLKVYAEMKGKTWTGKDGSYCVPTDLSKIFRQADNEVCRSPIYKRVDTFSLLFEPRVSKTHYLKNPVSNQKTASRN